jgi:hypothetical protein
MKRAILQLVLLIMLAFTCFGGYLLVRHVLALPFRATNDVLHKEESPVNLDFLIPAGVHIDKNMTIKEVLHIRFKKQTGTYERLMRSITEMVPRKYLYLGDALLFIFWTFLYLTFLRVFTFAGYGRALRVSLLLGACTYFFMPDFSPGETDDWVFVGGALLIMAARAFVSFRRTKREG